MSVLLPSRVPSGPAAVPATGLEVWQVALDATDDRAAAAAALLGPEELDRANGGTPVVRRRRVLLRAALRTVLGRTLELAPGDVPLRTTSAGRPYVDLPGAGWDVSCSRSASLGLVAVARGHRIGIDVEQVAPWDDAVLREGWLTSAEAVALVSLPHDLRAGAATRRWTQKEAALKALGSGLSVSTSLLPVSADESRAGGWCLFPVSVPVGFSATLASSSSGRGPGQPLRPLLLADLTTPDGTPP